MNKQAKPQKLELGEIAARLMQAQAEEIEALTELRDALGQCLDESNTVASMLPLT